MDKLDHWQARVDLACAFRWAARLGLHEAIANHFSLAVSADGRQFLINPYGKHFSEIRASDLILVDADDPGTLDRPDAPDITAWALHGALHRNQPQARCVLHTHSKYATALACLADSTLPPIEQNCMRFFERVAIDEGFDGMGLGDEAERVSRLPMTEHYPIPYVIRERTPIFFESAAEYISRFPHLSYIPTSAGKNAWAFLPMIVAGRPWPRDDANA